MAKAAHANTLPSSLDSTVVQSSLHARLPAFMRPTSKYALVRLRVPVANRDLSLSQKQGVLPLWFVDKTDYSRVGAGDIVETIGLTDLIRGQDAAIKIRVTKRDGQVFEVPTRHTMSADQLKWLRAGSALNHIRAQMG